MNRSSVQIKRPGLLGGLAVLAASAAVAACFSLAGAAARLDAYPIEIQAGASRLEAALEEPEAATLTSVSGGAGAVVWAVTPADCADCLAKAGAGLAGLQADGFEVRVVQLAPSAQQSLAAVLAENGERLEWPAVFWRRGREWRGTCNFDPRMRALLRADFNPEA